MSFHPELQALYDTSKVYEFEMKNGVVQTNLFSPNAGLVAGSNSYKMVFGFGLYNNATYYKNGKYKVEPIITTICYENEHYNNEGVGLTVDPNNKLNGIYTGACSANTRPVRNFFRNKFEKDNYNAWIKTVKYNPNKFGCPFYFYPLESLYKFNQSIQPEDKQSFLILEDFVEVFEKTKESFDDPIFLMFKTHKITKEVIDDIKLFLDNYYNYFNYHYSKNCW